MNNNRTNTLLLTVIGVATLLVAVIGASFAYFTAQLYGEEQGDTVTIGAGVLKIAYADGSGAIGGVLAAEGIVPVTTGEPVIKKEFTITGNNSTTAIMPYSIALDVTKNEFTDGALKYTFESVNTSDNGQVVPAVLTETDLVSSEEGYQINLGSAQFVGNVTDAVHTYTLNIFFPDTYVNQNEDKDKEFIAKIDIGVQEIINP